MTALPSKWYGDPADCVDELRKLRAAEKIRRELERVHKARRIRALVKLAKRGK